MDPVDGTTESTETGSEDAGAEAAAGAEQTPTPEVVGGEEAPSGGDAASGLPEFEAPFDISSLPEDQQTAARALEAQFKSEFTRKTQELAQQRPDPEVVELLGRLSDPDQVEDALNELAEKHGLEPVPVDDPGAEATPDEGQEDLPPEVQQLLEREQERQRQEALNAIHSHLDSGYEKYREAAGMDAEADLPADVEDLLTLAAIGNPGDDRLPNVERAVELVRAVELKAVQAFVDSKKAPPAPDVNGSGTGVSDQRDLSTMRGRVEAGVAAAERHFADA